MTATRAELVAHARDCIARGSKSFAAASRLFDPVTRERVWLLYAWCRRCDDLADDQELGGTLGPDAGNAERLEIYRRKRWNLWLDEPEQGRQRPLLFEWLRLTWGNASRGGDTKTSHSSAKT